MTKQTLFLAALVLLLLVAHPLHAQSGCANSPENPTAILALAGSAGAGFTILRRRISARKSR